MAVTRLHHRVIVWSLLIALLVGLGLLLNARLAPQPRCNIPIGEVHGDVRIDFLSDDGGTILTLDMGRLNGTIQKWDSHTGELLANYLVGLGGSEITKSADGRFVAVLDGGVLGGNLHLIDLKQDRVFRKILFFDWEGGDLVFSPQGTYLAFSKNQRVMAAWIPPARPAQQPFDLAQELEHVSLQNDPLAIPPKGYLVECSSGRVLKTFPNPAFLRFLADESLVFVDEPLPDDPMPKEKELIHWNPQAGKPIHRFKDVDPVDLSPDGRTLLVRSADKKMLLLDVPTKKNRPLIPSLENEVAATFSPDGKTLITVLPNRVAFWDVASGKQRHAAKTEHLDGPLLFSPDSAYFVVNGGNIIGLFLLSETDSGRKLWKRELGGFNIRFTADSQLLLVLQGTGIEIIDVKTGETRRKVAFQAPVDGMETNPEKLPIQFTKDGRLYWVREELIGFEPPGFLEKILGWLIKNSNDPKLKVVETATGRVLGQLQGPYGNGYLSNDGRTMITPYLNADGSLSLRCWDLPLRPPLRLVVGIPLGIGLLLVLVSWWRARRKAAKVSQ